MKTLLDRTTGKSAVENVADFKQKLNLLTQKLEKIDKETEKC